MPFDRAEERTSFGWRQGIDYLPSESRLRIEVPLPCAGVDGRAPKAVRLASVDAPDAIAAFAQTSSLRLTRAHAGIRGTELPAASWAWPSIQLISRSRGMRTDPPMRTDGIWPRAARSRTLERLIESNLPVSSALRRSGRFSIGP